MRFLSVTLPTIAENLALDEALLLEAEAGDGGEVLRVWEWPSPAVVLGSGCRLAEDVDEEACRADGVPIQRRSSGGGTVLLGPGCLVYSLVLAYERSPALREIPFSYIYILERMCAALGDLSPGMAQAGTSDLAAGGRKFSGNSQQRKRTHLLHHGTILYGFDVKQVGRYLKAPVRQPEYRGRRGHEEFMGNLAGDAGEIDRRLRAAWGTCEERKAWPVALVECLLADKYEGEAWLRRR